MTDKWKPVKFSGKVQVKLEKLKKVSPSAAKMVIDTATEQRDSDIEEMIDYMLGDDALNKANDKLRRMEERLGIFELDAAEDWSEDRSKYSTLHQALHLTEEEYKAWVESTGRNSLESVADKLLHPTGRCTCAGEGKCEWCVRTNKKLEQETVADSPIKERLAAFVREIKFMCDQYGFTVKRLHIRDKPLGDNDHMGVSEQHFSDDESGYTIELFTLPEINTL